MGRRVTRTYRDSLLPPPSPPPSEVRTHQGIKGFPPAPAPQLSYSIPIILPILRLPLLTWVFTHCNHAFSLRPGQTRLPQPLEFSQPRTESPCFARTRTLQERAPALRTGLHGPQLWPHRSRKKPPFRRVSPKNFPATARSRCKLSRSGRFSPCSLRYFPRR